VRISTSFRSRLRPVKRRLAHGIEHAWTLGIRALAPLLRRDARRWTSAGGQQVLVVAPHPDDEAMGCAGTLLLHAWSQDRVCVAIATDGGRSTVIADRNELCRQRRHEAGEAARLMRVNRLEWIGLPEGAWNTPDLQQPLAALIEEIRPHIIYAPSRIDFHPEHFRVAHALALALDASSDASTREMRVRIYQVQVPLNPLITNLVADVSAVNSASEAALRAYASQAGSVQSCYRRRRYGASWYGIAGQVEEFCELPAQRYAELHREPPALWPQAFRGLRYFPISDPLAYLAGLGERRKIHASFALTGC
jgi:N-acetylglucosamine malate deacetylase 1